MWVRHEFIKPQAERERGRGPVVNWLRLSNLMTDRTQNNRPRGPQCGKTATGQTLNTKLVFLPSVMFSSRGAVRSRGPSGQQEEVCGTSLTREFRYISRTSETDAKNIVNSKH